MTTSPSEPVDNPQLPDDREPSAPDDMPQAGNPSGGGEPADGETDQDSEPTSSAPEDNNPAVPDPPD